MEYITAYLASVWDILLEAAPYVLLGFFVAGLLKGFLPVDFVAKHLGKGKRAPVFKAALFGIPLPLCSCGVIPAAAGLRQQGASKGATTSFLISTPETGVDSMAVTYALLDPLMTVLRPLAAFLTAITAGLLVDALPAEEDTAKRLTAPRSGELNNEAHYAPPATGAHEGCDTPRPLQPLGHTGVQISGCGCTSGCCSTASNTATDEIHGKPADSFLATFPVKFRTGMQFAFGELIADIGKWLIFGIFIAALISAFLPVSFIQTFIGDGLFGMILMVAVGVPMYVCATASTPIAAALALKGLSPGAAMVFLLAGPATNAATITIVARTLGKRVAAVYVSSIAVVSVVLGLAVNWVYAYFGLSITGWVHATETQTHSLFAVLSAMVLIGLVLWQMYLQFRARRSGQPAHACGCSCGS